MNTAPFFAFAFPRSSIRIQIHQTIFSSPFKGPWAVGWGVLPFSALVIPPVPLALSASPRGRPSSYNLAHPHLGARFLKDVMWKHDKKVFAREMEKLKTLKKKLTILEYRYLTEYQVRGSSPPGLGSAATLGSSCHGVWSSWDTPFSEGTPASPPNPPLKIIPLGQRSCPVPEGKCSLNYRVFRVISSGTGHFLTLGCYSLKGNS